eukprot:2717086-Pyramimonas_sp.AAC.1
MRPSNCADKRVNSLPERVNSRDTRVDSLPPEGVDSLRPVTSLRMVPRCTAHAPFRFRCTFQFRRARLAQAPVFARRTPTPTTRSRVGRK